MRTYRSTVGPFSEGIFLTKDEIERICFDELAKESLLPTSPTAIRIDRFIEKRFVPPDYHDLGEGVLGFTRFGAKGVEEVVINSRLEDEGTITADRRIRSTLAHEGGHGLLHTHLFVLSALNPKLDDEFSGPKVLCRDEPDASSQKAYRGKWWEYQANRAIGSLLMPMHLAEIVLEPLLEPVGNMGLKALVPSNRVRAEKELSEVFDVNPIVARIRIEEIYPSSKMLQGVL